MLLCLPYNLMNRCRFLELLSFIEKIMFDVILLYLFNLGIYNICIYMYR